MARKKIVENEEKDYSKIKENITDKKVSEILTENFMPYSMSVIVSRAIPEIDGLKPSHRKVLYTMYLMGLLNGSRSKSANIAGQVLKLNPHSDSAAYETMVRLTDDNETLLAPLVDSKGNMGKHYSRDMAFSASRYCITGDSLIATNKGLLRIIDLFPNTKENSEMDIDITVKSYNSKNNKAVKFFNSGKHPIYQIFMTNGMTLKGTANHPILVKMPDGTIDWKLLQDIEKDDACIIDTNESNALFGKNDDLLEARVMASIFACSEYVDGVLKFSTKNRDMILPVFAYFRSEFADRVPGTIEMDNDTKIFTYEIKDEDVINKIKTKLDFSDDRGKAFLPKQVLKGTKEYQRTFIKYLFESNGEFNDEGKIFLRNDSDLFLSQLQVMLCTNFGILSNVRKIKRNKKAIYIKGVYNGKFNKVIGFENEDIKEKLGDNIIESEYAVSYVTRKILLKNEYNVYSVKVDSECHSFSANGFINHNTEAKLSKISEEFFKGINKNAVDFEDNYDATMKEPKLLPVSFPNVLANPNQGIAVGMASNICSFNLKELCDATILHIKNPKADLLSVMPGPDFTTGGYLLYEDDVMKQVYNTGKGSIKLRARYNVDRKNNIIEITQIPYTTTVEVIIEGIVDLIKKGKIKEINDVRDEIDKSGFKIAIDYKRSCDPDLLMKKLFKLTKLQDSFGCNFNVLINGRPKTLGVYEILDEWTKWRRECVKREYTFDLTKKEKDLHLLKGLEKILLNINKVIRIIRNTENDADVIANLMKEFKVDESQANYIADIKLRNLNKEYILNRTKDIDKISQEIENIKKVISSEKEINKIIIKELNDVSKKYGTPRKTEIIPYEEEVVNVEEIIEDFQLMLYRTAEGYIKKIPLTSMKNNPEIKLKDGDKIIQEFKSSNKAEILFFTNKCNVYKILAYNIKDCKPSDFGEYANNMLGMDSDEEVIYMCPIDYGKNVIICFENGKVAKFPLNNYETKNNRKKLINAFYGGSKVINIFVIDDDNQFGILTTNNKLLILNTKHIPLKSSKTTQGIQAIRLQKNAVVCKFEPLSEFNLEKTTGYTYKSLPSAGGIYKED